MKLLLEAWKQFTEGVGDSPRSRPSYLEPPSELVDDPAVRQNTLERLDDEHAFDAESAVPLQFDLPLSDEQEAKYHLDQQDRDEILQLIINSLVDEGLVGKVGNDLYYSIGD